MRAISRTACGTFTALTGESAEAQPPPHLHQQIGENDENGLSALPSRPPSSRGRRFAATKSISKSNEECSCVWHYKR